MKFLFIKENYFTNLMNIKVIFYILINKLIPIKFYILIKKYK
jgi:hypothetical protein